MSRSHRPSFRSPTGCRSTISRRAGIFIGSLPPQSWPTRSAKPPSAGDVSPFIENDANNPGRLRFLPRWRQALQPGTQATFNAYVASKVPSHSSTSRPSTTRPRKSACPPRARVFSTGRSGASIPTGRRMRTIPRCWSIRRPAHCCRNRRSNVYTRLIFDHLKQVAGFGEATASPDRCTGTHFRRALFRLHPRRRRGDSPRPRPRRGRDPPYRAGQLLAARLGDQDQPRRYQFCNGLLVYATASQGFRPGGVNQVLGLPNALAPYQSDSLWNYELGAKTSWLDQRLIFDIDGYVINWSNMQVQWHARRTAHSPSSPTRAPRG